jgi:hypothetical protein
MNNMLFSKNDDKISYGLLAAVFLFSALRLELTTSLEPQVK